MYTDVHFIHRLSIAGHCHLLSCQPHLTYTNSDEQRNTKRLHCENCYLEYIMVFAHKS